MRLQGFPSNISMVCVAGNKTWIRGRVSPRMTNLATGYESCSLQAAPVIDGMSEDSTTWMGNTLPLKAYMDLGVSQDCMPW